MYFLGRKINLSGISPAKRSQKEPNSVYMDTFREFCAQSTHFGQNGGWDESRGAQVFFVCGNPEDHSATLNGQFSPNVITKHSSASHRGIRKDILETFHVRGQFPP